MAIKFKLQLSVILFFFLIALIIVIYSYKDVHKNLQPTFIGSPSPTQATIGDRVDLGKFSIELPSGWNYTPQTGIDSFVGSFNGEGVTLLFDYGHYSNTLARDGDPKYDIHYENISGEQAKIVVSKTPNKGIVGVFFADIAGNPEATLSANPPQKTTLNINGENIPPELLEKVLRIFHTVTFNL